MKFRACFFHTGSVARVDDEDQTLGACDSPNASKYPNRRDIAPNVTFYTRVVVSPQRTDLVLSTNIPDIEFDVLVGDALNVETDSRNSGDILIREL